MLWVKRFIATWIFLRRNKQARLRRHRKSEKRNYENYLQKLQLPKFQLRMHQNFDDNLKSKASKAQLSQKQFLIVQSSGNARRIAI